jgi:hypothetical protein
VTKWRLNTIPVAKKTGKKQLDLEGNIEQTA